MDRSLARAPRAGCAETISQLTPDHAQTDRLEALRANFGKFMDVLATIEGALLTAAQIAGRRPPRQLPITLRPTAFAAIASSSSWVANRIDGSRS